MVSKCYQQVIGHGALLNFRKALRLQQVHADHHPGG